MRRVFRIVLIAVVVLGALGFGALRYLTAREAVPATTSYVLDMAEIRRLAGSLPGERALRVNYEQVGESPLPRAAVFAGEPFTPLLFSHGAHQLVFADRYGLIDSGFDEPAYQEMGGEKPFLADGWTAVQRALGGASFIVITHEHVDHLRGIAAYAEPQPLVGRLLLTKEQLENDAQLAASKFPAELRAALEPLDYERYHALAPGVVLVKAPGHTPGSQMVYVQLASGKELLFVGDVAWHMDQIRELWYRPRLVTWLFLGEDRAAVLGEFRALHELTRAEPVQLVVSHDIEQRDALFAAGTIGRNFEF